MKVCMLKTERQMKSLGKDSLSVTSCENAQKDRIDEIKLFHHFEVNCHHVLS